MCASPSTSWMKLLAPRKHPNTEVARTPPPKPKEHVSMTTAQEVFLGVLTPALSDLAVLTRVDAILEEDHRSRDEVRQRWAHLEPVVQAFYERLGHAEPPQASDIHASSEPRVIETDDVPSPPDPGALTLNAKD